MVERSVVTTVPPTEARYLEAALGIAHGFVETAVDCGGAVSWPGDELIGTTEEDFRISRGPVGAGMYSGVAGIGWFLAHAAGVARSPRVAELAVRALGDAVAEARDRLSDPRAVSLSDGASGIAMAAIEGADALGCAPLRDAALDLSHCVAKHVRAEPEALGETDLIGGLAGIVIALLAVHRRYPHDALREACREACRVLVHLHPERETPPALCGLAHGASGPAWALAETSWSESDRLLFNAARRLLEYERSRFSAERCAWPDLREPHRAVEGDADWPGWTTAWCHGALGIGAVRLRLYEATHDLTALAEASASIQAARSMIAGAAVALRGGTPSDVTLCHGLAGVAELFLLAHQVTGLDEHLRAARRVGDLCLNTHAANGDRWTCGLRGATDVPGLFLGRAGIGVTLLRLQDPRLVGSPALPGRRGGASVAIRRSTGRPQARRISRP